MKKLLLAFAAVVLLLPATSQARETVFRTRYEGDRITGVSASAHFQVEIVKSPEIKAVVEIDADLEHYLHFTRDDEGVVNVGLRHMSAKEKREFEILSREERMMKLTLYLPEIKSIHLQDTSTLFSSDTLTGSTLEMRLAGSSIIQDLCYAGANLSAKSAANSKAVLTLALTGNLVASTAGAANINVAAYGVANTELKAEGTSSIHIMGDGAKGEWTTASNARIVAEEFDVKVLYATSSGGSFIRANVIESLTTHTSGSSSILFSGAPPRINCVFGDSFVKSL